MDEAFLPLRDRLNLETARIEWSALQRFFAAGRVLQVASDIDLIEVAVNFVEDKAEPIQAWLQAKQLQPVSDDTARDWVSNNPDNLWAIVLAPWVLVQQR
jgi:hypothetical protein